MEPRFYMLIGLPGCGKSHWIEQFERENPLVQFVVVSSDNIVRDHATLCGTDYRTAHDALPFETVKSIVMARLVNLTHYKMHIINDQTNLTDEVRQSKLKLIPAEYKRIAVVFKKPLEVILRQQGSPERVAQNKIIPADVMAKMVAEFTDPRPEDFDEIIYVT